MNAALIVGAIALIIIGLMSKSKAGEKPSDTWRAASSEAISDLSSNQILPDATGAAKDAAQIIADQVKLITGETLPETLEKELDNLDARIASAVSSEQESQLEQIKVFTQGMLDSITKNPTMVEADYEAAISAPAIIAGIPEDQQPPDDRARMIYLRLGSAAPVNLWNWGSRIAQTAVYNSELLSSYGYYPKKLPLMAYVTPLEGALPYDEVVIIPLLRALWKVQVWVSITTGPGLAANWQQSPILDIWDQCIITFDVASSKWKVTSGPPDRSILQKYYSDYINFTAPSTQLTSPTVVAPESSYTVADNMMKGLPAYTGALPSDAVPPGAELLDARLVDGGVVMVKIRQGNMESITYYYPIGPGGSLKGMRSEIKVV